MTLVAVICDADDPCSVNTSYDPESFSQCHLGVRFDLCIFEIVVSTPHSGGDTVPLTTQIEQGKTQVWNKCGERSFTMKTDLQSA